MWFHVAGYPNKWGQHVLFWFVRNATDAVWSCRGLLGSQRTCCPRLHYQEPRADAVFNTCMLLKWRQTGRQAGRHAGQRAHKGRSKALVTFQITATRNTSLADIAYKKENNTLNSCLSCGQGTEFSLRLFLITTVMMVDTNNNQNLFNDTISFASHCDQSLH